MDLVSIIIPIYNARKYLEECLKSICLQTYEELEIICVDDGSKDGSQDIVRAYQRNDKRIVLLSQNHKGAGEARNEGMRRAKGKFIIFLDADDCFDTYMIEKAVDHIEKFQADIVIFRAEFFFEDNSMQRYDADWMLNRNIVGNMDYIDVKDSYSFLYDFTGCNPWNKLFRSKFVMENHLFFQNIAKSNDVFFVCMALVLAKRIALLDDKLVFYRINKSSIQGRDSGIGMEYYEALKAVQAELQNRSIYTEVKNSFTRMCLRHCIDKLWKSDIPEAFQILYQNFPGMQEEFNLTAIEWDNMEDYYLLKKWKIITNEGLDWKTIYTCRQLVDELFDEIMDLRAKISDLTKQTIRLERLIELMNKKKEWKVPYEKIGNSGDIAIYGAGDAGQQIYRQLNRNQDFRIVKWMDKNYERYREKAFPVDPIEEIKDCRFDKVIIAISEDRISSKIKNNLFINYGIDKDKIVCI